MPRLCIPVLVAAATVAALLCPPSFAQEESVTASLSISEELPPESLLDKLLAVDKTNRAGDAALTLALSGIMSEGASKVLTAITQIVVAVGSMGHPMGAARASNFVSLATTRRCGFNKALDFEEGPSAVLFPWRLGNSSAAGVAGPALSTGAMVATTHVVAFLLHRVATFGVGMRKRWGQISPAAMGYFLPTSTALGTVTFLKSDSGVARLAGGGAVVMCLVTVVAPAVFLAAVAGPRVRPTAEARRISVETLEKREAALKRLKSSDSAPIPLAEEDDDPNADLDDPEVIERLLAQAADPEVSRKLLEDKKILEDTANTIVFDEDEDAPSPADWLYVYWPVVMHARLVDHGPSRCFLFEELFVAWFMAIVSDLRQGERNCALAAVLQLMAAMFHVIYIAVVDPLEGDPNRGANALAAVGQVLFAFTIVLDNIGVGGAEQWVGLAGVLLALCAIAEAVAGVLAGYQKHVAVEEQIEKRREEAEEAKKNRKPGTPSSDGGGCGDSQNDGGSPSPRNNPLAKPDDLLRDRSGARGTSLETFQVAVLGEPGFLHERLARQRTLERDGMCFEYRLDAVDIAKLAAMTPAMREKMLVELDDAAIRRQHGGESPPRQGPAPMPPPPRRRPVPAPYAQDMFDVL